MIAPFPFESLPELTRAEVDAQARARRAPIERIEHAFSEILETSVTLRVVHGEQPIKGVTASLAVDSFIVTVDVETALAREVVARALSHAPGIDAGKPPNAALHGAFAAVMIHALRKAGVAARVATSIGGPTVRLGITIDGSTFAASVTVPQTFPLAARPAILDFPITLPLVAISCLALRSDVGELSPGDVFVPPGLLKETKLALVAPRSERGLALELMPDQRLVITKERFSQHTWEPPDPMPETNPTLEIALEAPVVVRVELGAVEMKAREFASLEAGDVISLQRKLGEHAILRIAGNEVARGELVQVDGEYGIRITSTNAARTEFP